MVDTVDDATVHIYKSKMTAAWEKYETFLRAEHDAYVAWQICAMECKYIEVPRPDNGKPVSTIQRMNYMHPIRQRLMDAEMKLMSCARDARMAQSNYELECEKVGRELDNDLFKVAEGIEQNVK